MPELARVAAFSLPPPRAPHHHSGPTALPSKSLALIEEIDRAIKRTRELELIEGYAPETLDTTLPSVIGDERQYSPHHVRMTQILSDSINEDANAGLEGYTHVIDAGTAAAAQSGEGIPLSVTDAQKRADWEGPNGWRASMQKEVDRVKSFGAWEIVSAKELWQAKDKYKERCSVGHIVIAYRLKVDADGDPKNPAITKKSRIAFADDKSQNAAFDSTFSGCADDITDRVATAVGMRMQAQFDTCDVAGAYFHGTQRIPMTGGVPSSLRSLSTSTSLTRDT